MTMKLTKEQLKSLGPCKSGYDWYLQQKTDCLETICNNLLNDKDFIDDSGDNCMSYLMWLLPRVMTNKQKVQYAIFAAELVIGIFEKQYPDDNRPRKAIQVAKDYLEGKAAATAARAADAAYAADAAAYAARAARAAYAAAYAADAAAYAARAATAADNAAARAATAADNAAAYAANAADNAAANAANAAAYAAAEIVQKCAHYGMELLGLKVLK